MNFNGKVRKIMKVWKNLLKIFILLILTENTINAEYVKENGKIYFIDNNDNSKKELRDVDLKTFKIIEEDYDFAKDKNVIYYKSEKVKDVDVNSFKLESFLIAKDKDSVYFKTVDKLMKINNFSSEESEIFFQMFMPIIMKDKNGIYTLDSDMNGELTTKPLKIDGLDIKSLEILHENTVIYYLKDKNNVYYVDYKYIETNDNEADDNDRAMEVNVKKVIGADSDSFETIAFYGKDKDNMYIYGKKIENVNPKTFKGISNNWLVFKDDKGIYYVLREENKNSVKELIDADLNSFEEISENEYYRDKNSVYYFDEYDRKMTRIIGADPKSFKSISYTFGKDKNGVYKREKKLNGVDPNTFEEIDASYTRDKNNVYYEEEIMEGIDPRTFEKFVDYIQVKDKNGIYEFRKEGEKVIVKKIELPEYIDLKTLKPIENYFWYSKDKNNVYFNFQKIKGADIKTFEPVNYAIGKDKTGVYYTTQEVKGVDMNSFEPLENNFFKDKNNVYYENKKLENIRPETFEVINYSLVKQDGNMYYIVKEEESNLKFFPIEKNVDTDTFEVLDENYTKDKNNAYYKGEILKGADVKTFEKYYNKNDDGYKIQDKNRIYVKVSPK